MANNFFDQFSSEDPDEALLHSFTAIPQAPQATQQPDFFTQFESPSQEQVDIDQFISPPPEQDQFLGFPDEDPSQDISNLFPPAPVPQDIAQQFPVQDDIIPQQPGSLFDTQQQPPPPPPPPPPPGAPPDERGFGQVFARELAGPAIGAARGVAQGTIGIVGTAGGASRVQFAEGRTIRLDRMQRRLQSRIDSAERDLAAGRNPEATRKFSDTEASAVDIFLHSIGLGDDPKLIAQRKKANLQKLKVNEKAEREKIDKLKVDLAAVQENIAKWAQVADEGIAFQERMQQLASEGILKTPENMSTAEWIASVIGQAIPSLVAATVVTGITRSPTFGGMLLGNIQGMDLYLEARTAGVSVAEAQRLAMTEMLLSTVFEQIPLEGILKGKGANALMAFIKNGTTEGIQEVADTIKTNLLKRFTFNEAQDIMDGWQEAFIGGFGAGGGSAVLMRAINRGTDNADDKELTQRTKDAEEALREVGIENPEAVAEQLALEDEFQSDPETEAFINPQEEPQDAEARPIPPDTQPSPQEAGIEPVEPAQAEPLAEAQVQEQDQVEDELAQEDVIQAPKSQATDPLERALELGFTEEEANQAINQMLKEGTPEGEILEVLDDMAESAAEVKQATLDRKRKATREAREARESPERRAELIEQSRGVTPAVDPAETPQDAPEAQPIAEPTPAPTGDTAQAVETLKERADKKLPEGESLPSDQFTAAKKPTDRPDADAAERAAESFGKRIVWIKNGDTSKIKLNGTVIGNDIFIDVDSKNPFQATVMHEVTHQMRRESKETFDKLVAVMKEEGDLFDDFRNNLKKQYDDQGVTFPENEDAIWEELAADVMAERATDSGFWRDLAQKAPEVVQRIIEIMDRVVQQFRSAQGDTLAGVFKDFERVKDAATEAASEFLAATQATDQETTKKPKRPRKLQTAETIDDSLADFQNTISRRGIFVERGSPFEDLFPSNIKRRTTRGEPFTVEEVLERAEQDGIVPPNSTDPQALAGKFDKIPTVEQQQREQDKAEDQRARDEEDQLIEEGVISGEIDPREIQKDQVSKDAFNRLKTYGLSPDTPRTIKDADDPSEPSIEVYTDEDNNVFVRVEGDEEYAKVNRKTNSGKEIIAAMERVQRKNELEEEFDFDATEDPGDVDDLPFSLASSARKELHNQQGKIEKEHSFSRKLVEQQLRLPDSLRSKLAGLTYMVKSRKESSKKGRAVLDQLMKKHDDRIEKVIVDLQNVEADDPQFTVDDQQAARFVLFASLDDALLNAADESDTEYTDWLEDQIQDLTEHAINKRNVDFGRAIGLNAAVRSSLANDIIAINSARKNLRNQNDMVLDAALPVIDAVNEELGDVVKDVQNAAAQASVDHLNERIKTLELQIKARRDAVRASIRRHGAEDAKAWAAELAQPDNAAALDAIRKGRTRVTPPGPLSIAFREFSEKQRRLLGIRLAQLLGEGNDQAAAQKTLDQEFGIDFDDFQDLLERASDEVVSKDSTRATRKTAPGKTAAAAPQATIPTVLKQWAKDNGLTQAQGLEAWEFAKKQATQERAKQDLITWADNRGVTIDDDIVDKALSDAKWRSILAEKTAAELTPAKPAGKQSPEAKEKAAKKRLGLILWNLRQMQVELPQLVRMHYGVKQDTITTLIQRITPFGLPAADSKRLADEIQSAVKAMEEQTKKKMFKALRKDVYPARSDRDNTAINKLLDQISLGILDENSTRLVFEETWNLPSLTEENIAKIKGFTKQIRDAAKIDDRNQYYDSQTKLQQYISGISGIGLQDAYWEYAKANVLFAGGTGLRNLKGTFLHTIYHIWNLGGTRLISGDFLGTWALWRYATHATLPGRGPRWKAWTIAADAVASNKKLWKTGDKFGTTLERASFLETPEFLKIGKGKVGKFAFLFQGKYNPLPKLKYVFSLMVAGDLVSGRIMSKDARAALYTLDIIREDPSFENAPAKDLMKELGKRMGYDAQFKIYLARAKAEGRKGIAAQARAHELAEQQWEESALERATIGSTADTLNNSPQGALGSMALKVTQFKAQGDVQQFAANHIALFLNVGVNIVNAGIAATPVVGLPGALRTTVYDPVQGKRIKMTTEERRVKLFAQAQNSIAALGIALTLAESLKRFKDDPDEDDPWPWFWMWGHGSFKGKQRQLDFENGFQPYALKLGKIIIPAVDLGPFAPTLAIIGNMADSVWYKRNDLDNKDTALDFTLRAMSMLMMVPMTWALEQSVLMSIHDVIETFANDGREDWDTAALNMQKDLSKNVNLTVPAARFIKELQGIYDPRLFRPHSIKSAWLNQTPVIGAIARKNGAVLSGLNIVGQDIDLGRGRIWSSIMPHFMRDPSPTVKWLAKHDITPTPPRRRVITDLDDEGTRRDMTPEELHEFHKDFWGPAFDELIKRKRASWDKLDRKEIVIKMDTELALMNRIQKDKWFQREKHRHNQ